MGFQVHTQYHTCMCMYTLYMYMYMYMTYMYMYLQVQLHVIIQHFSLLFSAVHVPDLRCGDGSAGGEAEGTAGGQRGTATPGRSQKGAC